MEEKVLIRSSDDGNNGSSVYMYTLNQGDAVICKEASHAEIAKVIKEKYPSLEGRIKEYFNIGINFPEELSHLDPTPQTQLIRQIVGLVNAIEKYYEYEEEKVLKKEEQKPGRKEKRKKKQRTKL